MARVCDSSVASVVEPSTKEVNCAVTLMWHVILQGSPRASLMCTSNTALLPVEG